VHPDCVPPWASRFSFATELIQSSLPCITGAEHPGLLSNLVLPSLVRSHPAFSFLVPLRPPQSQPKPPPLSLSTFVDDLPTTDSQTLLETAPISLSFFSPFSPLNAQIWFDCFVPANFSRGLKLSHLRSFTHSPLLFAEFSSLIFSPSNRDSPSCACSLRDQVYFC